MEKRFWVIQREEMQKVVYIIPSLKAEDVVKVKAYCNKYGDKSISIAIDE